MDPVKSKNRATTVYICNDTMQSNSTKGGKKNYVNQTKRKTSFDGNEIEHRTMIIQLERPIKKKR